MNTKQWVPALTAFLLVSGSVQAFADSGWNYDEDSDTVIPSYSGNSSIQPASRPENVVEHTGAWYYDEDSESIAFSAEGSRSHHIRTNPSTDTLEPDPNLAFLDQ